MKHKIPNMLTSFRIIVIPLIAILILSMNPYAMMLALLLYIIAALSDFFDGYFARKWKVESGFGRMLDPIADKLLIAVLLLALVTTPLYQGFHIYGAMIILFREIFVSGLREFLAGKHIIHVSFVAKIKTTIQLIMIGAALLALLDIIPDILAHFTLWVAALLTLYTGIIYFIESLKVIKKPTS